MFADILIEHASQLITINTKKAKPIIRPQKEDLGIVEDGAVAIDSEKGEIISVGTTEKVKSQVSLKSDGTVISASGKVVMPGFVDPHTHIVFGGTRLKEIIMRLEGKTYKEIQEAGGGIHYTVNATRKANDETLYDRAFETLDSMLQHGTTTVEIKSGYGLNTEDELRTLRIIKELDKNHEMDIISTFLGAHLVPVEYINNRKEYVKLLTGEMIQKVAKEKLADFCDVFCEDKAFTVEESREILLKGKSLGLHPRIHADELGASGGSELAGEIKAISADHLNYIPEKGISALADNGVIAILLPGTSFFLNLDRYPPAREMIEKGVPVALATDYNAGSCWTYSMQMIISLACIKLKMTPEEAVIASTINPACALKKEHILGSLENGKKADIIICNVSDYEHMPFHYGTNQVFSIIKNGKILFSIL